ncbi:CAP domain-containing protein [Phycicoccus duodecadis]|uniref:CAP domain-containing protein n=1 Tax=Phycicoccus duodecadis TaxID=173053 RepID=UPI001FE3FC08|nr:CAP domain-containing protein [Phycicoccus duodecadis]
MLRDLLAPSARALAVGSVVAAAVALAAPADARPLPRPGGVAKVTWVQRSTTTTTSPDATMAREVLTLVNVERAKAGCPAAHWDTRLAEAARLHSVDMATRNYFSHTSLDGRSPWDRIRAQGYLYGSAENIAAGQPSASSVMAAWMNSSGHRANILACANVAVGVGVGRGGSYGIYWTQDFGRV